MRRALVQEVTNALQGLEVRRMDHEETAVCITEIKTGTKLQQHDAWRKLLAAYFVLGATFASRYLWRFPADEIVHFVYRGLLQAVATYKPEVGAFSTWLVVCVRSESIDRLRHYIAKDKYGPLHVAADTEMTADRAYDRAPDPSKLCVQAEIAEVLAHAVDTLPAKWQRVIRETVMRDTPGTELAAEFQVTRECIRQYKVKALQYLRDDFYVQRLVRAGLGSDDDFCDHT